jgi:hypothetical protein
VRGGVFAHFDADPAAAHLVRHGGRGAGAEEAVEDEVVGVGGDVQDALEQSFGFRGAEKRCSTWPKRATTFFCSVHCACTALMSLILSNANACAELRFR